MKQHRGPVSVPPDWRVTQARGLESELEAGTPYLESRRVNSAAETAQEMQSQCSACDCKQGIVP